MPPDPIRLVVTARLLGYGTFLVTARFLLRHGEGPIRQVYCSGTSSKIVRFTLYTAPFCQGIVKGFLPALQSQEENPRCLPRGNVASPEARLKVAIMERHAA